MIINKTLVPGDPIELMTREENRLLTINTALTRVLSNKKFLLKIINPQTLFNL